MQKNRIKKKVLNHIDKIGSYIIVFSIFGLIVHLFIELKPLNKQIFVNELILQLVLKIFMWCSIGFSLFYILLFVGILIKHSLVYNNENLREIKRKMKTAKIETKAEKLVIHGQIIVIFWLAFVVMLIYFYMFYELIFFIIFCIVILLWSNLRISNPPTILFLSSSKSLLLLFNHYDFKCLIRPLRIISLLEYFSIYNYKHNYHFNNEKNMKIHNELTFDIYRTEFNDDWKNTFNILLDLTKIVIIDTDSVTTAVLYEAEQIIKKKLHYKCIFLKNENNDVPLLNNIKNNIIHIENELCVLNFKECFKHISQVVDEYNFPTPSKSLKAIKINSNNKEMKNYKSYTADESNKYAINCLDTGKFDEAEKFFLIGLNSTYQMNESIWTNLSIVSINMKKYEKALYRVEKALELNSNHPNAIYTKGLVLEKMRDMDNALIYYQKFLEKCLDKNSQQFKDTIRRIAMLTESKKIESDDAETFLKPITIAQKEKIQELFAGLIGDSNRKIGYCYLCKEEGHFREMVIVDDTVNIDMSKWNKPWNPTQSCYQCAHCGRLFCYSHCDDRIPCVCGAQNWITRSYIQNELDNG